MKCFVGVPSSKRFSKLIEQELMIPVPFGRSKNCMEFGVICSCTWGIHGVKQLRLICDTVNGEKKILPTS